MKPVIIDINEMSDSSEVYYSKPNKWINVFIYFVLIILASGLLWAYFSKLDIVVKSNGILKTNSKKTVVSSDLSGIVNILNVKDGQYVNKGENILELDSKNIKNEIQILKDNLEKTDERLEILNAYNMYLSGDKEALIRLRGNSYYEEFYGKKNLLELGNKNLGNDYENTKLKYNAEIKNLNSQIEKNANHISKIEEAIKSMNNRKNSVLSSDSYYHTLVNSFLSNYNVIKDNYNNQINDSNINIKNLESQINLNKKNIENLKKNIESETSKIRIKPENTETSFDRDEISLQDNTSAGNAEKIVQYKTEIDNLTKAIFSQENEIQKLKENISKLESSKEKELSNLNLQQITALEQEKNSIKSGISTLKANRDLVESQLSLINNSSDEDKALINVESEKQNVSKELMSYQEKKKDLEDKIKKFDIEDNKANIVANETGYITFTTPLKEGLYLSQGQDILTILPENFDEYIAELYVKNEDIGKIKENQEIKIEIPAYPSSEYGFINGVIESISKETKIDENKGQAFYVIHAKLKNPENDDIKLTNDMLLQAKIVVEEKRVLTYLLEKINLWD